MKRMVKAANQNPLDVYWNLLVEYDVATDDEINLVTSIDGYNEKSLLSILEVRTGLKNFDQLVEGYAD